MAATVSTQLTSTTSPSSTGSCQLSTLPSLTELSSPASKLIQKQISTATTISSPSSSISSLFERVTNFRRSLIKSNLHKKGKSSRPQSGSFNLFYGNNKSLTSQEVNGKCLKETINRKNNKAVTKCSTLSTTSATYGFYDDIENCFNDENTSTSLINNIPTMTTTMLIHVDEEDAIYGFTAMNLNNPTKRQLKQPSKITPPPPSTDTAKTTTTITLTSSSLSSSSSSTSSSSLSNVNKYSSSLLKQTLKSKNDQLLTSSSCISLYETIDECETDQVVQILTKPNQAINGEDGEKFHQNSKVLPNKKSYLSKLHCPTMNSYQHHRFHNQPIWNRNRRTSAFFFANNGSEFEPSNFQQSKMNHCQRKSLQPVNFRGQHSNNEHFQYSCSSLQSRSSDDILMITSSSNINNSNDSPIRSTRIYENITNNRIKNGHHRASYFPDPRKLTKDSGYESSSTLISLNKNSTSNSTMTKHTTGYGILNTSLINKNFEHSRSDSIDSSISHKSIELLSNNLVIPTSLVSTSPELQEDSPPPTPPIRFSSLPENHLRKSLILPSEDKPAQSDTCSANLEKSSWPYNLYPKMRRKLLKYQHQQLQPPPFSSPLPELDLDNAENLYDNELIPPSSSNNYLLSNYAPEPVTQLVRSHRVLSAAKQEISLPSTNNYILAETSNLLPPILPPKNQFRNHYNIKEIQKRAVYEFYLRQKEKKRSKIDKNESKQLLQSNNLDKSKDIYSNIETISKCEEESLPLPEPPPPLTPTNESFSLPSNFCSESVKISKSILPNNLSFTQQKSPLEIINERYQFNLMKFWPLVNIGQLMSTLVVVFNNSDSNNNNNNNDDDDNEHESELSPALDSINQEEPNIEQELIRIDQTRKLKHRMLSRKNLLLMEQTRIEHNLSELETIGIFVRDKLEALDKMQKNKLDLITIDMVRIIGLIFSIHRQINECYRRQMRNISEENNNQNTSEDNLTRLKRQLLEARQLRDGIEQRCLMFIERIKSRFDDKVKLKHFSIVANGDNNEDSGHHQDSSNLITEKIETILATLNEYNKSPLSNAQENIGAVQNDFNLSSLSQFYLTTMEMLTIQKQLIHFLINQEMINVLER